LWSKIDDAFTDHPKIFAAGDHLGKDGPALAVALFVIGVTWSNRVHSDGYLPSAVVKRFKHCSRPLDVAHALVKAKLWESADGGFKIHDFLDWNFSAREVNERREAERERKRNGARKSHGIRRASART
jgi:hypothetical protein